MGHLQNVPIGNFSILCFPERDRYLQVIKTFFLFNNPIFFYNFLCLHLIIYAMQLMN